jgi:hypothetical protein
MEEVVIEEVVIEEVVMEVLDTSIAVAPLVI